jgi:hypothetical protein
MEDNMIMDLREIRCEGSGEGPVSLVNTVYVVPSGSIKGREYF